MRQLAVKAIHLLKTTTSSQRRDVAPYMFIEGTADLGTYKAKLRNILMDSGALHGSYISNTWYENNRDRINPTCVKAVEGTVVMGDDETTQRVNTMVVLTVIIRGTKGKSTPFTAAFSVIEMKHDMIIGLPDLVSSIPTFFVQRFLLAAKRTTDMLATLTYEHRGIASNKPASLGRGATKRHAERVTYLKSTYAANRPNATDIERTEDPSYADLLEPWQEMEYQAAEERDTHLPVLFGQHLAFMEMTEADARQEYIRVLDAPPPLPGERMRFHPELLKNERFNTFMRTVAIDTFVPSNWEGINTEDVHINFDPSMPKSRKIPCRPIPHKRVEPVTKEIKRLCSYHLLPSNSSIVSALVVADKATDPFVRLCGDYRWVNNYVLLQHGWIPVVQVALEKLKGFNYYIDLDLSNAFHQFRIDFETSEVLALLTPEGTLRPKFLPEGVAPASAILQTKMMELFSGFDEWLLVIFDNCVIGGNDMDELMDRYELFIARCQEKNIFLKLSKSYFGVTEVFFFGYIVDRNGFRFDQERLQGLSKYTFPTTGTDAQRKTAMQQFLGAANFFRPAYVYASGPKSAVPERTQLWTELTGALYETTNKNFNWDATTYVTNYAAAFRRLQDMLLDASRIFFPDYALPWVLRTDASILGIGAILFQIRSIPDPNGEEVGQNTVAPSVPMLVYEPIATISHKFSGPATRWATIKQECYSIYYAVKKLSHLLTGKEFVVETDHANLVFLEKSEVPILTRWRLYMQTFKFLIRHIPGVENVLADSLSRQSLSGEQEDTPYELEGYGPEEILNFEEVSAEQFASQTEDELVVPVTTEDVSKADLKREYPLPIPEWDTTIAKVHGGVNLHFGVDVTWKRLNKLFRGHKIPVAYITRYVEFCGGCQKLTRDYRQNAIEPVIRHLRPPHPRETIGIDMIAMTPDANGNRYAHVVMNHFSKFVLIYATKTADAIDAARAVLRYRSTIGPFRVIMSDPGSNYMSKVMDELNNMLGIAHRVSLVDRHESNGVEPMNQQIKRHVQAIIQDERFTDRWSSPEVIDLIQHELNNLPRPQTAGYTAMELNTGTLEEDESYAIKLEPKETYSAFSKRLAEDLVRIRKASKDFQDTKAAKAKDTEDNANEYQEGDLVLLRNSKPESKNQAKWLGPFKVLSVHKNDVVVRHASSQREREVHVKDLRVYYGSQLEAFHLAIRDSDEYIVSAINHYGGDPMKRQTLYFNATFQDDTVSQLLYEQLKDTEQLALFISQNKELRALTFKTHALALEDIRATNSKQLPVPWMNLQNQTIYLDIRSRDHFDFEWYEAQELDDKLQVLHVMPYVVTKVESKGTALELVAKYPKVAPSKTSRLRLKHYGVITRAYLEQDLVDIAHVILPDMQGLHGLGTRESTRNRDLERDMETTDSDDELITTADHLRPIAPVLEVKIYNLNANGLNSAVTKGLLNNIPEVDHVCIQETKISANQRLKYAILFKAAGYRSPYYSCHSNKGYAGVAIFSRRKAIDSSEEVCTTSEVRILAHQTEGRLLTLVYTDYLLVTAYVPFPRMDASMTTQTIAWRRLLSRHLSALEERYPSRPIIFAGDLNGIRTDLDATRGLQQGVCCTPDERQSMSDLVHHSTDVYRYLHPDLPGHTATCRIPPQRGETFRLDYILASKQCIPLTVEVLDDTTLSDHYPIYVHIKLCKATHSGSMNSFGKEYSSDVTGDGPKTPPKGSGIRQYLVPHTTERVGETETGTALELDQYPEVVAIPLVTDPNLDRPSRRHNKVWLITHGTNAGQIYEVYEAARLAAINTVNQSRGNTKGFLSHELAREYARLHLCNIPPVVAESVEPMDMSHISEAVSSSDTDTSSPPYRCRPCDQKDGPMRVDLEPINSNDLLAPSMHRYTYKDHRDQLVDVGRSLQSYCKVEALQIIAIAKGDRITMQLADELQYPDNKYLVALTDDIALNCSSYANCQRPICMFSMANNADGLIDHPNQCNLTDDNNNAAAWTGTYQGVECVLLYALIDIEPYTDIMWNYHYAPLSPVATPKIGDGLRYLHAVIADLHHRYLHEEAQDSASEYGFS